MKSIIDTWRTSRSLIKEYLDKYSLDQLNKIPEGFSNNLIWNIGHIIAIQQALVYIGSNLKAHISKELLETYKNGSIPTQKTTLEEVNELKHLLTYLIEQTEIDFNNAIFLEYNPRKTSTGFFVNSLQDAFQLNNYHEGMHLGMMINIRKFL